MFCEGNECSSFLDAYFFFFWKILKEENREQCPLVMGVAATWDAPASQDKRWPWILERLPLATAGGLNRCVSETTWRQTQNPQSLCIFCSNSWHGLTLGHPPCRWQEQSVPKIWDHCFNKAGERKPDFGGFYGEDTSRKPELINVNGLILCHWAEHWRSLLRSQSTKE